MRNESLIRVYYGECFPEVHLLLHVLAEASSAKYKRRSRRRPTSAGGVVESAWLFLAESRISRYTRVPRASDTL